MTATGGLCASDDGFRFGKSIARGTVIHSLPSNPTLIAGVGLRFQQVFENDLA
ncbi:MAG: hypothetical protein AABP62_01270 [Planctomycetota bacterium]